MGGLKSARVFRQQRLHLKGLKDLTTVTTTYGDDKILYCMQTNPLLLSSKVMAEDFDSAMLSTHDLKDLNVQKQ